MTQAAVVYVGPTTAQFELPAADSELLPGVRWGLVEAFPTPAYWAYQVLARRLLRGPVGHRLGANLAEEVGACLLGGHGLPARVGLAAFHHLKAAGVFAGAPTAPELEHLLRQPLTIDGRAVRYRFARQKARYLSHALRCLAASDAPTATGRALRDWLLQLEGVGFKTASWIARNWLDADDVAILDIHVLRAGALGGFLDPELKVPRDYLALEAQFLATSRALGVRASELDAVIWYEMMASPRSVARLMHWRAAESGRESAQRGRAEVGHADSVDVALTD
jgi:thermostable 8-oxoguanine DNA glycosylase